MPPFARRQFLAVLDPRRLEIGAYDPAARRFVRHAARAFAPGSGLPDVATLATAIAACAREAGGARRVRLALAGPLVRMLTLPLGYMPARNELATAVQTEIERYRVFAGVDVQFDFAIVREEPDRLSLLFTAIRRVDLAGIQDAFARAGVALESVEPAAVSLVRTLARDYAPCWDVSGEPCGIAAATSHSLEIVTWSGGRLLGWRTLDLDAEALSRGDVGTVGEAALELQRSAADAGARRWLVYRLPRTPALAGAIRPDAEVTGFPAAPAGEPGEVMQGLALAEAGAMPPTLDLLPRKETAERVFTNAQLLTVSSFGLILAALLGASAVLDGRARAEVRQLDALHARLQVLQMSDATRDRATALPGETAARMARSAAMAMLFEGLRDVTPADTWITDATVKGDGGLGLGGASISRGSPMAFARALASRPDVADVSLPDVRLEQIAGQPVYRFSLVARLVEREARR